MNNKEEHQPLVFVAGAALIDIVSAIYDYRNIQDNLGFTSIHFGGVAYNLVVNLKSLGVDVRFMTALNDRAFSRLIRMELESLGVDTKIKIDKNLPDQIYNGFFHKGEQIASVWNSDIEDVEFGGAFMLNAIENASCIVIANDLSKHTINTLIRLAGDKKIPVFIGNITTMGALRLREIEGKIELVFINQEEIDMIVESSDHLLTHEDVAREMNCKMLVTGGGSENIKLLYPDGTHKIFEINPAKVSGTTLGAGDLFMATTIKFLIQNEQSLEEAVKYSVGSASAILDRNDANIGKHEAFDTLLQALLKEEKESEDR